MSRPPGESGAPDDIAPRASEIVRFAVVAAFAANTAFPIIEIWRMIASGEPGSLPFALFATAVTLALNLRHVAFGLRNERPPAGEWTLGILAAVHLLALALVGRAWALQLGSLMVSTLIVMRGPSAIAIVS